MVKAMLPTLQMGKLRLREVNPFAQCHMATQTTEEMTFRTPDSVAGSTQLKHQCFMSLSFLPARTVHFPSWHLPVQISMNTDNTY